MPSISRTRQLIEGPHRVLARLPRLSLAQQLVLLAVLPAALATLGAIVVLTRQHLENVTELMRTSGQTVALQVATLAQTPLNQMDRRALQRTALAGTSQPHVQQVQIRTADGEILANAETPDRHRGEGLRVLSPVMGDDGIRTGEVMVEISLDAVTDARKAVYFNV